VKTTKGEIMSAGVVGWPFWIGIVTENLERQRRFYADVLGLEQSNVGDGYVQFDVDGKMLELLQRTDDPEYDRPRVQIGFEVSDIQDARAKLIELGAEPITGVLGSPDGVNHWAYFRDPDGNVFEITQRTR
jgi:catechol 2,3-dioxygenase-like lactoylglutathione lyase family enzyme